MSGGRRGQGETVEGRVARWLSARGWTILDRNFHAPGGEVDLVAHRDEILAFVEVRSRKDAEHGWPEETVTPTKQRRVILAARHWLHTQNAPDADPRFDVVAVLGEGPDAEIRHLEDAFEGGP